MQQLRKTGGDKSHVLMHSMAPDYIGTKTQGDASEVNVHSRFEMGKITERLTIGLHNGVG